MAVWECAECTTKYSVGAPKCPHCGSVVRVNETTQQPDEETDMAKVTVHGGPSNDNPPEPGTVPVDTEGSEQPSPSSSSETSSEKPQPSPEKNENETPSRARTTGSRSKKAPTDSSSAPGTDGGQEAGTSAKADSK